MRGLLWVLPRGGVAADRCDSASDVDSITSVLPGPGGTARETGQEDPVPPENATAGAVRRDAGGGALCVGGAGRVSGGREAVRRRAAGSGLRWPGPWGGGQG